MQATNSSTQFASPVPIVPLTDQVLLVLASTLTMLAALWVLGCLLWPPLRERSAGFVRAGQPVGCISNFLIVASAVGILYGLFWLMDMNSLGPYPKSKFSEWVPAILKTLINTTLVALVLPPLLLVGRRVWAFVVYGVAGALTLTALSSLGDGNLFVVAAPLLISTIAGALPALTVSIFLIRANKK